MINQYDRISDLEFRSKNLASLLYILGYERDSFDSITIDDAINMIRDTYVYKHDISENAATQSYIKKQNILLTRNIRRAWFDVQFSQYEAAENGR